MIHHITITTLHHPSPTYSGIDQQEAFPTMYILMLVTVLTLTKIIEIPTLSPRKFAPLAYFDKYICRRLVASQAVLLARVLLVSMAVGGEVVWGFTGISFVPILPRPFQFRVNPPRAFISIPPSIPRTLPYASAETHNSEIPLDKSFNLYIPSCFGLFLVSEIQKLKSFAK